MDYRKGVCRDCGASYKLPATFAADKAKCKKCEGVVEIGPVVQAEAPAPKKPAAAAPMPARKIAPQQATPKAAPKPAAKPVAKKPVAKKPATSGAPAGRSAAKKPVARTAGTAQGTGAPKRVSRGAGIKSSADSAAERIRGASRSGASAKAGAKKSSAPTRSRGAAARRSRGDDDDDEPRSRRGGGRGRKNQEKNWGAMIGGLVALLLAVGGTMWYLNQPAAQASEGGDDTEVASKDGAEGGANQGDADGGTPADGDGANAEGTGDEPISVEDGNAMIGDDEAGSDDAADPSSEGAGDAEPEKPKVTAKPKGGRTGDPSTVDLAAIEDFERFPGTSDDEWAQLQEWADVVTDPNSPGRKLGPAREGLVAATRKAFPAILNSFKRMDLGTDAGARTGQAVQDGVLTAICSGRTNFSWDYKDDAHGEYFRKKVVSLWCTSWRQCATDDEDGNRAWANLSKIKDEGAAGSSSSSDDDDLGDF